MSLTRIDQPTAVTAGPYKKEGIHSPISDIFAAVIRTFSKEEKSGIDLAPRLKANHPIKCWAPKCDKAATLPFRILMAFVRLLALLLLSLIPFPLSYWKTLIRILVLTPAAYISTTTLERQAVRRLLVNKLIDKATPASSPSKFFG